MTDAAPFPFQLMRLLDRREGHVGFNYAVAHGLDSYALGRLDEMLQGCQRTPAKYRNAQLADAAEFARSRHETSEEISRQWSAHVDALCARYERGRAVPSCEQALLAEVN